MEHPGCCVQLSIDMNNCTGLCSGIYQCSHRYGCMQKILKFYFLHLLVLTIAPAFTRVQPRTAIHVHGRLYAAPWLSRQGLYVAQASMCKRPCSVCMASCPIIYHFVKAELWQKTVFGHLHCSVDTAVLCNTLTFHYPCTVQSASRMISNLPILKQSGILFNKYKAFCDWRRCS